MRRRPLLIATLVLLLIVVTVTVAAWRLLSPTLGPPFDPRPQLDALQERTRPSPDTPDAWPVVAACLLDLHHATARADGFAADEVPDFSRLYDRDLEAAEWEPLATRVRELIKPPSFELLLSGAAGPENAMDPARARAVLQELETPTFAAHLDQLGEARWMTAQRLIETGNILLPYISDVRQLSQLLMARLQLDWERGDLDAACRDIRAHLGLARAQMTQPFLVEYSVGVSTATMLLRQVNQLMDAQPPPAPWHTPLADALAPLDDLPHWRHPLAGERVLAHYMISAGYSGTPESDGRFLPVQAEQLASNRQPPEPYTISHRIKDLKGLRAPRRRELTDLVNSYHDELEALDNPTPEAVAPIQQRHVDRLDDLAPGRRDLKLLWIEFDALFEQPVDRIDANFTALRDARDALRARLAAMGPTP